MSNVPEIRFKGFTDAWEQRRFNDIIQNLTGGASIEPNDYQNSGVRTIPKGAVNASGVADLSGSKFISETFFDKNKSSKVSTNDLVTSLRDLVPSAPNMGRIVRIVGCEEDFLMPQGVYRIELIDDTDEYFVISYSNSEKYRRIISAEKNGSTQVHIRNGEFLNIEIPLCNPEEQTRIGTFFRTLDDTIALYKRKLDALKRLKSGYLQQMFPQVEESVPKVRFEGFFDAWETKKLGDLITLTVREVPKPSEPYKRLSIRSHAKGTFNQIVDDPSKVAMDSLYVVHENDLIINITFAWEHAIAIATQQDHGLLVSHRFPTYVIDKSDVNFLRILVTQETFRQKLDLISPGGAGRNRVLNKNDFANLELIVPCIDEQDVIGRFFNVLDKQIASQTQKLEQLGRFKGAYLQKMFI
ncbi:MAG: restriction endonuclease subunit S [Oscillospiraceae bacterium]|nr:restriction endonuclease subunit S [Oscillospiraceae bacterium]